MPDGFIQVPTDSTGKRVDVASLDVSTVSVMRQRVVIGDNSAVAEFAVVSAGSLQVSFPSPQVINNISAAVTVNPVNISNTPSVILAAGTAVFGTLNNISATVIVAGAVTISLTPSVILAAGTAVFGTLNNISASVLVATGATADFNTLASADQVQNLPIFGIALPADGGAVAGGTATNPFIVGGTVNVSNTPSVVLAAGTANIGTIQAISAAVTVNPVNISNTPSVILAAGTANFGTLNNISATVLAAAVITAISAGVSIAINAISAGVTIGVNSISATVTVAQVRKYASLTVNTASHGPRMVLASTSANVTLVTAPGAGLAIYVTMVGASNASGTNTRGRFGSSATVGALQMMMAASGGGFVMQLDPPWKLSTNEALVCSVKPNVSEGMFNCNFFVASADAF